MQAAITGGTGFIGTHLLDALLDRGWKVRLLIHRRLPHVEGRIDKPEELKPLCQGAEIVFHLASAMGSAQLRPKEFYQINVEGTRALLQAARIAGVRRVVHVSSAGVLGAVPAGVIADENYPPRPITLYDQTKWRGENEALQAASFGQDVVIARPGWVYGPRDRRTLKLIKAIKKKKFFLVGSGCGRQSPVWVGDLIHGLLRLTQKGEKGRIYHLAGGEILSVKEMAETIAQALHVSLWPWALPVLPVKTGAYFLDFLGKAMRRELPFNLSRLSFFLHSKPLSIERARLELGYSPQVSFAPGISLAIRWYQENGWL